MSADVVGHGRGIAARPLLQPDIRGKPHADATVALCVGDPPTEPGKRASPAARFPGPALICSLCPPRFLTRAATIGFLWGEVW